MADRFHAPTQIEKLRICMRENYVSVSIYNANTLSLIHTRCPPSLQKNKYPTSFVNQIIWQTSCPDVPKSLHGTNFVAIR